MPKEKEKAVPTGLTLAEIAQDKQTIEEFLLENEGEIDPTIEALMLDNETAAEQKIVRVAGYIATEEAFAEAIQKRAAAMAARARGIHNRVEWFKNGYVARALAVLGKTLGGDRVDGDEAAVRVQLNNPRLNGEITPEMAEEMYHAVETQQYVTRTVTFTVDRVALLRDAKLNPALLPEGITIVRDASVRIV